jgi:hypothetical protein
MLLADAEKAAKEAVETWLRLHEDDQRALREYMGQAERSCAAVLANAHRLSKPSAKRGGGDCLTVGERSPTQAAGGENSPTLARIIRPLWQVERLTLSEPAHR